jgi:hypothetical protein
MREFGRNLDLTEEPLVSYGRRELGVEHLERNPTVVLQIFGKIDDGHAAASKLTLDAVALSDSSTQAVNGQT